MILDNPVTRLMLRAMSVCGLIDDQRDFDARRDSRAGKKDSPFVLVGRAPDGRWGVFQRDFDNPQALFGELQDACNYANELARTRADLMVLIQKNRDSAAHPDSSIVQRTA
jgi:hypothetical protein